MEQNTYSEADKFARTAAKKEHMLTEKLAEMSDETLDKVDEAVKSVQAHAKEYSDTIENYIKSNPLKSVGIAVLVGVVLDSILRR